MGNELYHNDNLFIQEYNGVATLYAWVDGNILSLCSEDLEVCACNHEQEIYEEYCDMHPEEIHSDWYLFEDANDEDLVEELTNKYVVNDLLDKFDKDIKGMAPSDDELPY